MYILYSVYGVFIHVYDTYLLLFLYRTSKNDKVKVFEPIFFFFCNKLLIRQFLDLRLRREWSVHRNSFIHDEFARRRKNIKRKFMTMNEYPGI